MLLDAQTGEQLAFSDTNHYAAQQIKGGVYPLSNTEQCPDFTRCGSMQAGYPMLYAKHADADTIDRKSLAASVAEVTGLVAGHTSLRAIVGTFLALRELASATATAEAAGDRRKVVERRKGA